MRKVFIVTGANGFLGNNIVRKLVERNVEVRCLVLPNDNVKALEGLNCKIYKGDVTKKNTYTRRSRIICNTLCSNSIYKSKV